MVHVPKGVPVSRFMPPPMVQVPVGSELPLISKDSSAEKKLQQMWISKIRIFDLGDPEQLAAYAAVWQKITDGHAGMSEHRVDFHDGKYTALLRWADFEYKLPNV